ncbi:MAG: peptidylprolyl isomerase [Planctomycetota bacterium]
MYRSLLFVMAALLAAVVPAQKIPGCRLSLQAPAIVPAKTTVELQLFVEVEEDVDVPSVVLNGLDLEVRIDGEARPQIQVEGRGAPLRLNRGTRIVRTLRLPLDKLLDGVPANEVRLCALSWRGLVGVDCSFKIAPSAEGIDVDQLDLAKTEVVLVTTHGEMRLQFRPDKAPNHVRNFVKLCLQGFYDGTKFHRVMKNFMIQGGCPNTLDDAKQDQWGLGGPGYSLDAEFNDLRHLRGTLSMARGPDPNSAGSGFFVVHADSAHLDKLYTAFGNLVSGVDTLDRIANLPVGGKTTTTPKTPVVLRTAIVLPVMKK